MVVFLDTKKEKQNGDSSYSLAALLKHQYPSICGSVHTRSPQYKSNAFRHCVCAITMQ